MFPSQLKIKSESSGRHWSLLPRQPFSWLPVNHHNLGQFLPPAAASKQQKWTVLHGPTMTVCTRLYRLQKAMVALLSPVSLTSLLFFQEGGWGVGGKQENWPQSWLSSGARPTAWCVCVYQLGLPLSSLLVTLPHLSFPCFNLLVSQAAETIILEPVFPFQGFIPTRPSFATVCILKYLCQDSYLLPLAPPSPFSSHSHPLSFHV